MTFTDVVTAVRSTAIHLDHDLSLLRSSHHRVHLGTIAEQEYEVEQPDQASHKVYKTASESDKSESGMSALEVLNVYHSLKQEHGAYVAYETLSSPAICEDLKIPDKLWAALSPVL